MTVNKEKIVKVSGQIVRVVFSNAENGYSVLKVKSEKGATFFVTGSFSGISTGTFSIFSGSWVKHKKFGLQFCATSFEQEVPSDSFGIEKYLGSGLIKGVGPSFAKKLVFHFGSETLKVIDQAPQKLLNIPGIGSKKVENISKAWQGQKEISNIMVFLRSFDISVGLANKIFKAYGNSSIEKIKENPYRISKDIFGIGFKTADQLAFKLGVEKNSLERVKAALIFCLREFVDSGSLYAKDSQVFQYLETLLEIHPDLLKDLISKAVLELSTLEEIQVLEIEEETFWALSKCVWAEQGLAKKILNLKKFSTSSNFDLNKVFLGLHSEKYLSSIELSKMQKEGICNALSSKISIITGGPGTGKTTLLKALVKILKEEKISFKLAAPTGRAAKRMSQTTGEFAETIHRLLEFSPKTMRFERNEKNCIKANFLIVDEFSMVDVFLANSLFKACAFNCQVLLLGDVDQLESVGAGRVFSDLIESKKVLVTKLDQIFRQAQESGIIQNSHRINKGELPFFSKPGMKKDFVFVKMENPEQFSSFLAQALPRLETNLKIKKENSIVLCPMHKGVSGTSKVNSDLQDFFNSKNKDKNVFHFSNEFRVGDRVMQIKNNYDKNVFNGDIGNIEEVNQKDRIVKIVFFSKQHEYDFSELNEIVLAYSISVHKSQGSEFGAVIIPVFTEHFMMLSRNILYTAVSRAKKMCILVGQTKALAIGVKNNKKSKRVSFLKNWLESF